MTAGGEPLIGVWLPDSVIVTIPPLRATRQQVGPQRLHDEKGGQGYRGGLGEDEPELAHTGTRWSAGTRRIDAKAKLYAGFADLPRSCRPQSQIRHAFREEIRLFDKH